MNIEQTVKDSVHQLIAVVEDAVKQDVEIAAFSVLEIADKLLGAVKEKLSQHELTRLVEKVQATFTALEEKIQQHGNKDAANE